MKSCMSAAELVESFARFSLHVIAPLMRGNVQVLNQRIGDMLPTDLRNDVEKRAHATRLNGAEP